MSGYLSELKRAMHACACYPRSVFMGQAVAFPGTAMSQTFEGVDSSQLIEMPVAEDMQMGMAIGMSLAGYLPICVYPRWNFLLLATNQLVLHLDKLPVYSDYCPKVIIRVATATHEPMDPGPQHLGDYHGQFNRMLRTVDVVPLRHTDMIEPAYEAALASPRSTILAEYAELYA